MGDIIEYDDSEYSVLFIRLLKPSNSKNMPEAACIVLNFEQDELFYLKFIYEKSHDNNENGKRNETFCKYTNKQI
jgi:hypothetical protein